MYYTYNNEALAACVILKVLQAEGKIDIARSCIILPFLLDDKMVKFLMGMKDELTLSEIKLLHPRLLTTFNRRFLALLPVTINSIVLLSESNQIEIGKSLVPKKNFSYDSRKLGQRFDEICQVIPRFTKLTDMKCSVLYNHLNIPL